MTNSALEIWKEIYINGEVSDDTSFVAIDLLLNGFSSKEKKRILNEVFSTFKSTFIAYRFIYFNFIKDDIPDDEQVKVVNPYDLTSLDVKMMMIFKKEQKLKRRGLCMELALVLIVTQQFMTTEKIKEILGRLILNVAQDLRRSVVLTMEHLLRLGG
jgi:hypothetical protein